MTDYRVVFDQRLGLVYLVQMELIIEGCIHSIQLQHALQFTEVAKKSVPLFAEIIPRVRVVRLTSVALPSGAGGTALCHPPAFVGGSAHLLPLQNGHQCSHSGHLFAAAGAELWCARLAIFHGLPVTHPSQLLSPYR